MAKLDSGLPLHVLLKSDPLSPLLFVLTIDPLQRLLEVATTKGLLSKLRGRTARLRISIILRTLPVKQAAFPVKYLGLPLHVKRLKRIHFQPLVDKAAMKMSTWQRKHFTQAGRVCLAKTVLSAQLATGSSQEENARSTGHAPVSRRNMERFARALRLRWLWHEWASPNKTWIGTKPPCDEQDQQLFAACTTIRIENGKKASFWTQHAGCIKEPDLRVIWETWAPPKSTRGWDHSPTCPLCRQVMETARHLASDCRYTKRIWDTIRGWWKALTATEDMPRKASLSLAMLYHYTSNSACPLHAILLPKSLTTATALAGELRKFAFAVYGTLPTPLIDFALSCCPVPRSWAS
nr:unnamed protein product [Digitaria exilis]